MLDEKNLFTLQGWRNIRIRVKTNVDNDWLAIGGYLIHVENDEVQEFEMGVEYYYGVEDGESWSEGSREGEVYISSQPRGEYMLLLECIGGKPNSTTHVHVIIEQGVPRFLPWLLTVLGISAIPLALLGYHVYFNQKRWQNSSIE